MIIICEPICLNVSHEKVNSGFLYGLHLAFPEEGILFYADITHIEAIKKILIHDNVYIEKLEYVPIKLKTANTIFSISGFYLLFKKIFLDAIRNKTNKVFFLSFSSIILYVLKKLKSEHRFFDFKITLVLHGGFENIAGKRINSIPFELPRRMIHKKTISEKFKQIKLIELPKKIIIILSQKYISKYIKFIENISLKLFPEKKILLWKHSPDFKFISLSPHVTRNAMEYIDVKYLNINTIILPTIFVEPDFQINNDHPKFAVFGWGDPLMFHNILYLLSMRKIKNPYEIRIIGANCNGSEGFSNVTCFNLGRMLYRSEMESFVKDIDYFLILYNKDKYRLSCSGSILEAISYIKPVIHFENDCIDYFNNPENPIGISCSSIEEFVSTLNDIITNYNKYLPKIEIYKKNIIKLRQDCAIENSISKFKKSFTW